MQRTQSRRIEWKRLNEGKQFSFCTKTTTDINVFTKWGKECGIEVLLVHTHHFKLSLSRSEFQQKEKPDSTKILLLKISTYKVFNQGKIILRMTGKLQGIYIHNQAPNELKTLKLVFSPFSSDKIQIKSQTKLYNF